MPTQLISEMIQCFSSKQHAAIQTGCNLNDAKSVWFDLKSLKNFVAQFEEEVKKVNPQITDADLGVRFYYAAYPTGTNWTNSPYPEIKEMHSNPILNQQAGRHTLIMMPTLKRQHNGQDVNVDFNPYDPASYTINNHSCLSATELMAMNHGSLFPPFDPAYCLF